MKNIHINSAVKTAILIVILSFTSCSDWLTVVPETELIKDKFWKKTEDVNSALGAAYNALRNASLESLIWGELRADLVTIAGANFSGYEQIAGSNISPSNEVINWKNYYEAINLANTLMYFDDEVFALDETFTQEMMNAIEAEALFIRSMAYFYLVRLWKDVPLVTTASISDTSDLYVAKSSENEILAQLVEDLLYARDLAYKTEFQGSNYFYGRANYYSITALLADVYLWQEKYQNCIDACDVIINSGLYSLEPTETWFNLYYPGNSSSEGVCEIQYDDNLEQQENPIYNNLVPLDRAPQASMNWQNINLIMDQEDLRRYNGLGGIWKTQGKDQLGLVPRTYSERDANWILYRYAEIMLIKAEACIELDRFSEANDLISETMLRAGAPFIEQTDKELLRELLLNERGREFLFEGRRWFDLLRAAKRNKFENKQLIIDMILSGADIKQQAILRTRVYDTLSYYLPVPERELIYNQNLEQNPFYNR
ncbi:MAG: RagB/SusD family nutrient uptake outer membrane protein [Bacteroidales bacterium]